MMSKVKSVKTGGVMVDCNIERRGETKRQKYRVDK